jgi:hypothetical protein
MPLEPRIVMDDNYNPGRFTIALVVAVYTVVIVAVNAHGGRIALLGYHRAPTRS